MLVRNNKIKMRKIHDINEKIYVLSLVIDRSKLKNKQMLNKKMVIN